MISGYGPVNLASLTLTSEPSVLQHQSLLTSPLRDMSKIPPMFNGLIKALNMIPGYGPVTLASLIYTDVTALCNRAPELTDVNDIKP